MRQDARGTDGPASRRAGYIDANRRLVFRDVSGRGARTCRDEWLHTLLRPARMTCPLRARYGLASGLPRSLQSYHIAVGLIPMQGAAPITNAIPTRIPSHHLRANAFLFNMEKRGLANERPAKPSRMRVRRVINARCPALRAADAEGTGLIGSPEAILNAWCQPCYAPSSQTGPLE